jgi:excisionase family DNA binding protein
MSDPSARLLLRKPEAARLLGISPRKLDELLSTGKIPAIRFGRSVRISIADIEDFIEASRHRGPAPTNGGRR